jgi:hypothetical protein
MSRWFERYQQGFYQEVYDELLVMQEQVFEEPVYREAVLVVRAMMSRVRSNIEILIPRLKTLGYQFVDGDWVRYWEKREQGKRLLTAEQEVEEGELFRIFRAPPPQTSSLLDELEQRAGRLPLSVKGWYEEVGSVNLIGMFPASAAREELSVALDPLLIVPVDFLMGQFPFSTPEEWEEARDDDGTIEVDLAVDADLKYNYSGSGGYSIKAPCPAFDTTFDLIGYYESSPTFVNYLRTCFQWSGMFGLSKPLKGQKLTPDELVFLTRDLLPF